MSETAADLARRLARNAEAVCRYYLSNGRRAGRYWTAGDARNEPGRSLFVRLTGPQSGTGAAGKWTDAATGEHGDLLDLIAANQGLDSLAAALDEARRFLGLPHPEPPRCPLDPTHRVEAACRLWALSRPIAGTLAETYLRQRGMTDLRDCDSLRFHPRCWYRSGDAELAGHVTWPALIAAVRDRDGKLTGVHRTWLDPSGAGKAPVSTPRRALGHLLGHGVRFGRPDDIMAAGEGIETMLSLRQVMPAMPMMAALSANHLAALLLPATLRRLYLARDNDPAGRAAVQALTTRARQSGIEALTLGAILGDLNDDLRHLGRDGLAAAIRVQLAPEDVARFLVLPGRKGPTG